MELSQLQKLACEGVWRALRERNINRTDRELTLKTPEPQARRAIADYVCRLPIYHLPAFILSDINQHGLLSPGYTRQWNDICDAGKRHDAHVAAQKAQHENQPLSQNNLWPEYDVSSSSHMSSQQNTESEASNDGTGAETDKTPMASPQEKTKQMGGLHCEPT